MASFIVYGDASGQVTVKAPAVAGSNTITFPAETGTLYTTASTSYLAGQIAWNTTVQTTGFTAVAYGGYFCNTTSAAFTVTLPATPTRGQFVVIVDYAGTSATNNITVSPNGGNINGATGNATIKTNRTGITFTYIDATQGWLTTSNVYAGNPPFTQPYTASYLVVAGGGGSGAGFPGSSGGGGGGAGGLLTGTLSLIPGTVYTAVVGGGGTGVSPGLSGTNGTNSTFPSVPAAVGGGGGGGSGPFLGLAGGSGGGGGGQGSYPATPSSLGGSGTPGQGSDGGIGKGTPAAAPNYGSGGGGGSGGVGAVGTNTVGGAGGAGTANSITGSSVIYAGGGGGATYNGGTAGLGGPGTPGVSGGNAGAGVPGTVGVANTGGGAGGCGGPGSTIGINGGSGVVILSVPTANYSGTTTGSPTITTSGSNTIIKWTTAGSGTYTA